MDGASGRQRRLSVAFVSRCAATSSLSFIVIISFPGRHYLGARVVISTFWASRSERRRRFSPSPWRTDGFRRPFTEFSARFFWERYIRDTESRKMTFHDGLVQVTGFLPGFQRLDSWGWVLPSICCFYWVFRRRTEFYRVVPLCCVVRYTDNDTRNDTGGRKKKQIPHKNIYIPAVRSVTMATGRPTSQPSPHHNDRSR